ncbi:hypothetical protein SRHO_G00168730 [Serrasalmus rhombeus]
MLTSWPSEPQHARGAPTPLEAGSAEVSVGSCPAVLRIMTVDTDLSSKDRDHGGPEGMEPDGIVESNWNEIKDHFDDMNAPSRQLCLWF